MAPKLKTEEGAVTVKAEGAVKGEGAPGKKKDARTVALDDYNQKRRRAEKAIKGLRERRNAETTSEFERRQIDIDIGSKENEILALQAAITRVRDQKKAGSVLATVGGVVGNDAAVAALAGIGIWCDLTGVEDAVDKAADNAVAAARWG